MTSIRRERVFEVFDGFALDREDVEPTRHVAALGLQQPQLGGANEAAAFDADDGLGGRAMSIVLARAHFDEHDGLTVIADEIDLAAATTPVAVEDSVTLALKELSRARLGVCA